MTLEELYDGLIDLSVIARDKLDRLVLSKYVDLTEGSAAAFHAEEACKAVLAKEAKDAEEVGMLAEATAMLARDSMHQTFDTDDDGSPGAGVGGGGGLGAMLGAGMGEMISGGGSPSSIDEDMDDLDALEIGGGDDDDGDPEEEGEVEEEAGGILGQDMNTNMMAFLMGGEDQGDTLDV